MVAAALHCIEPQSAIPSTTVGPCGIPSADILEDYRSAIASATGPSRVRSGPGNGRRWAPEKRDTTIGRLLNPMNVEIARHAGHIDIVRELIDGIAGDRRIPDCPIMTQGMV